MEEYMKNQTGHIKAKNVESLAYFLDTVRMLS